MEGFFNKREYSDAGWLDLLLIHVKQEEEKTVKEVKSIFFSLRMQTSKFCAKSEKKIALLHDRETVTCRNSALLLYPFTALRYSNIHCNAQWFCLVPLANLDQFWGIEKFP